MMAQRFWGVQHRYRDAQKMDQARDVLKCVNRQKSSSGIGRKWARCEDAEWMLEDFIQSEKSGEIWGLRKEDL